QPGRRGLGRSRIFQDQRRVEAVGARIYPSTRNVSRTLRRFLASGADKLLSSARRQQRGLGQYRHLWLARLSDADQDQFSLPRFDLGRSDSARSRSVYGSRTAFRDARRAGMAQLLLQKPYDRAEALPRA